MVGAFGGVSGGHFNPAVSLAVFISKKLKLTDLIAYWVFQIGGAVAAVYLLKQLYGDSPMVNCMYGLPSLAPDVWPIHGIVAEGVMTFFLAIVVLGTAVYKGGIPAAPLMIGLTITAGALAGGALTGAAINPARYLGSALVSGQLGEAHIYLLGTFGGGLLAGLLSYFVIHKEDAPVPAA